ncbi:gamma-glutamyltransferase family protein [Nakamurella flavida]
MHCRALTGDLGAVSAAHPSAAAAAVRALQAGGTAVDATIAAQAVVAVLMPHSAGLGGDMFALVHEPDGTVGAVNGSGRSAARPVPGGSATGIGIGAQVTVPGMVAGWFAAHERYGRLPVTEILAPARRLARRGAVVDTDLAAAVAQQRPRLQAGGAGGWDLLALSAGDRWRQPALADALDALAGQGPDAFYRGPAAAAITAAVGRHGGTLSVDDLAAHVTDLSPPLALAWDGGNAHVQPPPSQGVLLAMALAWLQDRPPADDHLLVELTEAVFAHRADCFRGAALLDAELVVDPERATRRGGPRAYLHTAGVAVADAAGMVVSSLVSVFDDFGSGIWVPELGCTLNNRGAGFTDGANAPAAGARPVHTLAPALTVDRNGDVLALATPGADGQIQTLLQVLTALRRGDDLATAVAAPRWRSEHAELLVEAGHPARDDLSARGHGVRDRDGGDPVFGAVVAAGTRRGAPYAAADWRRFVWSAVA